MVFSFYSIVWVNNFNCVFVIKAPIIKMLLLLIFSNLLYADQFFSSRYTKSIPTIYIHFYFIYKRKVFYITIIFYIYSSTFTISIRFKITT